MSVSIYPHGGSPESAVTFTWEQIEDHVQTVHHLLEDIGSENDNEYLELGQPDYDITTSDLQLVLAFANEVGHLEVDRKDTWAYEDVAFVDALDNETVLRLLHVARFLDSMFLQISLQVRIIKDLQAIGDTYDPNLDPSAEKRRIVVEMRKYLGAPLDGGFTPEEEKDMFDTQNGYFARLTKNALSGSEK